MATRKKLYAEGTSVSESSSRAEIERTLARYGASTFGFGIDTDQGISVVTFRAHDRIVRFELPIAREGELPQPGAAFQHQRLTAARADAENKRRWRAMAMAIKSKLEVVESGIATFEEEFLAHVVLPDGSTVGAWAAPALEESYATGTMPGVLPGGQSQLSSGE